MNIKTKTYIPFILTMLIMSSCAAPVSISDIVVENEMPTDTILKPTDTLEPTSTLVPTDTETPVPTETPLSTLTPTLVPTFTSTPLSAEWDLHPIYTQTVEDNYRGVNLKVNFVTDGSWGHKIKSMTMSEDALLDTAARTIFRTWWCKGGIANPNGCSKEREWLTAYIPSTIKSSGFLEYWETAQRTGSVSDWQKVQLKDIWVNDLSDGNGYVLEPYTLWPMYEGQTPPGVRAFNEITFVFVRSSEVVNVTRVTLNQKYIESNSVYGVNILDDNLVIYFGDEFEDMHEYGQCNEFSVN